jgi:hypothetical protein
VAEEECYVAVVTPTAFQNTWKSCGKVRYQHPACAQTICWGPVHVAVFTDRVYSLVLSAISVRAQHGRLCTLQA